MRGVEAPGASALLLLFILAEYAGPDGCCFPSQDTLSARSCLSVRAVRDNLKLLEEAGLISQERRTRRDGTRTSNLVRLLYYAPEEPPAKSAGCQGSRSSSQRQSTLRQPAAGAGLTSFDQVREPITSSGARARPALDGAAGAHAMRNPVSAGEPSLPDGLAGRMVAIPPELRAHVLCQARKDDGWAASYLDRCGLNLEAQTIHPVTNIGRAQLVEFQVLQALRAYGLEVGDTIPLAQMQRFLAEASE